MNVRGFEPTKIYKKLDLDLRNPKVAKRKCSEYVKLQQLNLR